MLAAYYGPLYSRQLQGLPEAKDLKEILSLAARMQEATAELLLQVDDVVAANSHVAVVGSVWGDREGKILFGTREMAMFRVEGGIVVEGWTHVFDPAEVDRFWS